MTPLDQHVRHVRTRLMLSTFTQAWARALVVGALLVLAYVLLRQFTLLILPGERVIGLCLWAVTFVYASVVSQLHRPTAQDAAGRMKVPDPVLAAEHFASFTYGHLFMKRIYGVPAPFDAVDVERRVIYVVDAFLRAHAP